MKKREDQASEAIQRFCELQSQEGIFRLLPTRVSVGVITQPGFPGMFGGFAYLIDRTVRSGRARSVEEDPRLRPLERKLLRSAARARPDCSWTELWLRVTKRKGDIRFLDDPRTCERSAEETRGVLSRIGDVSCFLAEHPKLMEGHFADEAYWWEGFLGDWGVAAHPERYARRLAPEPLPRALEDVVGRKVAKSFRELCEVLYRFLSQRRWGAWSPLRSSESHFRSLAGRIYAELYVAGFAGLFMSLLGKAIEAREYTFSLMETRKTRLDPPVELEHVFLIGSDSRVTVAVREKGQPSFHEELIAALEQARSHGRFSDIHVQVASADWDWSTRAHGFESVVIGEGDVDSRIWERKDLIGPAVPVETPTGENQARG